MDDGIKRDGVVRAYAHDGRVHIRIGVCPPPTDDVKGLGDALKDVDRTITELERLRSLLHQRRTERALETVRKEREMTGTPDGDDRT